MGCGDKKLSKYLTQTFTAHCSAMIYQQVTLSGDAEWPKVADAVIEAEKGVSPCEVIGRGFPSRKIWPDVLPLVCAAPHQVSHPRVEGMQERSRPPPCCRERRS